MYFALLTNSCKYTIFNYVYRYIHKYLLLLEDQGFVLKCFLFSIKKKDKKNLNNMTGGVKAVAILT